MATRLGVSNEALAFLGQPALATLTDDVPSRYLLDAQWDEAVLFVLRQAPWRLALKTSSIIGATSGLISGYDYSFAKPAGWLRSHSIYVLDGARECPLDIKDEATKFYANVSPLVVRHVSSDYDDPAVWTEHFATALAAFLAWRISESLTGDINRVGMMGSTFQDMLTAAMQHDAIPESPWLVHQLDGSFLQTVLGMMEEGMWRFAIRSVELEENGQTASPGYDYAFDRPSDWIRTAHLYQSYSNWSERRDIDFREEDGQFHAAYSPIVLRYLSKDLALDSRLWSSLFQEAVLARLNLRRAAANPDTSAAALQVLSLGADAAFKMARNKDDMRERPVVDQGGRLERARFGGGTGRAREQGWGWW